jgi:GTPase SAR1 family protein
MGTSNMPSLDRFLPENEFGVLPELRLFLHIATKDVSALGPQFSKEYRELHAIEDRIDAGMFRVAVLGPPGSGTTTLINALLGETFLPSGVEPLIGVPIFVRYGLEPLVRIWSHEETSGDSFASISVEEFFALLFELCGKEDHFQQGWKARRLEILHPAPILRQGIVLVNVPEMNPDSMSQWEVCANTLAQCEAVLFVASASNSPTEINEIVLHEIQTIDIPVFFILNKVEELNKFEEEAALECMRKAIQTDYKLSERLLIFSISARRGLDAKLFGDWPLWKQSGLQEVESHLTHFLLVGKVASVRMSISKELADILQRILSQIRLTVRSLQLPLDSLKAQLHDLEKELEDIQRQRVLAKVALKGDLKRILRVLEREADFLRRTSRQYLNIVVEEHLSGIECSGNVEQMVQDALGEAIGKFFGNAWKDMALRFQLSVSRTLSCHWDRNEKLAYHVIQATARLVNAPGPDPSGYPKFEMKRKPYWVLRKWVPAFPRIVPEPWIDKLMPAKYRKRRLTNRLLVQVDSLVSHNVENLRWALYQNVRNAFRRFAAALDEKFLGIIVHTRGTIEAACYTRHDHPQKITGHIARLESGEARLQNLCEEIQSWVNGHHPSFRPAAWGRAVSEQKNKRPNNTQKRI